MAVAAYTQNLRLRTPKVRDRVDVADFDSFFTVNMTVIDTSIQSLRIAVETLQNSGYDDSALNQAISGLSARVRQLEENYETLLQSLETDDLSAIRSTLQELDRRLTTLEANAATSSGTGGSQPVDLSGINNAISRLEGAVSGLQETVGSYGTRLSALESWKSGFLENASGAGTSGSDSGGSTGVVDTSGLAGQILALRRNVESDMLIMSNRLVLLESAAFADFSVDETDYKWYARNIRGIAVDGPFEFGFVNSANTLAEFFNLHADSGDNSGGVVLEPDRPNTLAEIFGFNIE